MVPFEREIVSSYRSSIIIVTFTRFRDIAAFVLQHTTSPPLTLLKISPCSSGTRWMAFGLRGAKLR